MAPSIWTRRDTRRWTLGIEPIRPIVYGCLGWRITSRTGPISTRRPAYITATRSAVSAMTPMSWVMSMTAAP